MWISWRLSRLVSVNYLLKYACISKMVTAIIRCISANKKSILHEFLRPGYSDLWRWTAAVFDKPFTGISSKFCNGCIVKEEKLHLHWHPRCCFDLTWNPTCLLGGLRRHTENPCSMVSPGWKPAVVGGSDLFIDKTETCVVKFVVDNLSDRHSVGIYTLAAFLDCLKS